MRTGPPSSSGRRARWGRDQLCRSFLSIRLMSSSAMTASNCGSGPTTAPACCPDQWLAEAFISARQISPSVPKRPRSSPARLANPATDDLLGGEGAEQRPAVLVGVDVVEGGDACRFRSRPDAGKVPRFKIVGEIADWLTGSAEA
jgi:hypothetical protein